LPRYRLHKISLDFLESRQEYLKIFATRERPGLFLTKTSRLIVQNISDSKSFNRQAVFLDRDGVIIEDVNYLTNPNQIQILPSVVNALNDLQKRFYIVVVTNQSAVARGMLTENELNEINFILNNRLSEQGINLDAIYYCPHLIGGVKREFNCDCPCRKPKPGMFKTAEFDWGVNLNGSYMVGDSLRDITAANLVGLKSFFVGKSGDLIKDPKVSIVSNLGNAAKRIISELPH